MSYIWLVSFIFLASISQFGNALQCYSYVCSNTTGIPGMPNPVCAPAKAITCDKDGAFAQDRCMTQRYTMKMAILNQVYYVQQEMRNCSYSIQCNPLMTEKICSAVNVSGNLASCQIGCCQGDLCNSGGPIPTNPPQPTGPSGSDLSCYSCASVAIPGMPVIQVPCTNPAKQTCGVDSNTGMKQNRCMQMKVKHKMSPISQVMRNCSVDMYCIPGMMCKSINSSGELSECDVSCCVGNLCNSDAKPSTPLVTLPYSKAGNSTTSMPNATGTAATETVQSAAKKLSDSLAVLLFAAAIGLALKQH